MGHAMTSASARDALALLEAEPDAWNRYSLADFARRVGVSRQRIHQVALPPSNPRPRPGASALLALIQARPEVVDDPKAGGMSTQEIADAIEVSTSRASVLCKQLGLPNRKETTLAQRIERLAGGG